MYPVASSSVWRWTPAVAVLFVGIGGLIVHGPSNSFLVLIGVVAALLVIGVLVAFFSVILRSPFAGAVLWIVVGAAFAIPGGTIAWWLYYALADPQQERKLELALALGFMCGTCLLVGCSTIAGGILELMETDDPNGGPPSGPSAG